MCGVWRGRMAAASANTSRAATRSYTHVTDPSLGCLHAADNPQLMDDLPTLTTQTVIGIAVAISGNVLISLALNLQKLAHKRLNAERNSPNPALPPDSILGRRENLEEQDADSDTIITEIPTPRGSDTPPDTQPLLPVNHRSNHYTMPQRDKDPHEPQATGFFARLFRTRHQDNKKETFLLPIDVMPEDAALDHPRNVSDIEDENESAYLKSKLWCVFI